MVATTELHILDEPHMHLDRPDEPWSVHLEVGAEGHVDEQRLTAAVRSAAGRHPVARARLAPDGWKIDEALPTPPVRVVHCGGDADLAAAREALLSYTPPLGSAPPFALVLAHHPGGDSVLLNLHHAAVDGLGALRLMGSILRAYASVEDTCTPLYPAEVRDISSWASGGEGAVLGYGFELMRLDAAVLLARRDGRATAGDVLLAALGVTVRRWNERRGADVDQIALMMPVSLQPGARRTDAIGNPASYVAVHFGVGDHDDLDAAIPATVARTRRIKEDGVAGLIVDLLDATSPDGSGALHSAALANVGRLEGVPDLGGDAGAVRSVWFSPPGRVPLGASVGTATLGDGLFVTLRYRRTLFEAAAAADFAALYRDVLIS